MMSDFPFTNTVSSLLLIASNSGVSIMGKHISPFKEVPDGETF